MKPGQLSSGRSTGRDRPDRISRQSALIDPRESAHYNLGKQATVSMLSKATRLDMFYSALLAAPAAASFEAARELLVRTLLEIEDKFSGISRGEGEVEDGRMYPPRNDARRSVVGRPDLGRYRARWHNVYYSSGGAILIVAIDGKVVLSKPGNDGGEIVF